MQHYPFNTISLFAFPSGPLDTNAYLILCEKTKEAVIIDPAPESTSLIVPILQKMGGSPQKIILTHSHWDHIADVNTLKETLHIPLYAHEADAYNLFQPGADQIPTWYVINPIKPDTLFHDEETFSVGNSLWNIIHTPGHSPGSSCFYCKDLEILISGDTLFRGAIGNTSFPSSLPEKMAASLKKLVALPKNTQVFPGHGSPTTIGKEERRLVK